MLVQRVDFSRATHRNFVWRPSIITHSTKTTTNTAESHVRLSTNVTTFFFTFQFISTIFSLPILHSNPYILIKWISFVTISSPPAVNTTKHPQPRAVPSHSQTSPSMQRIPSHNRKETETIKSCVFNTSPSNPSGNPSPWTRNIPSRPSDPHAPRQARGFRTA